MPHLPVMRKLKPLQIILKKSQALFSSSRCPEVAQVLEQVRQWVLANDAGVYPEVYHLLAQADIGLERAISNIKCPTLVVTGEEDHGNSPAMSRRMAELIPGARAEILEGLRHMALAEDPDKVNTLLLSFLLEVMDVDVEENS